MDSVYERLVPVAVCGSRIEAELKRSVLDAEGIQTGLSADDAGGMHPEMTYCGSFRLIVPESEAERAQAVLRELDEQRLPPDDTVGPDAQPSRPARRRWAWVALAVLVVVAIRIARILTAV